MRTRTTVLLSSFSQLLRWKIQFFLFVCDFFFIFLHGIPGACVNDGALPWAVAGAKDDHTVCRALERRGPVRGAREVPVVETGVPGRGDIVVAEHVARASGREPIVRCHPARKGARTCLRLDESSRLAQRAIIPVRRAGEPWPRARVACDGDRLVARHQRSLLPAAVATEARDAAIRGLRAETGPTSHRRTSPGRRYTCRRLGACSQPGAQGCSQRRAAGRDTDGKPSRCPVVGLSRDAGPGSRPWRSGRRRGPVPEARLLMRTARGTLARRPVLCRIPSCSATLGTGGRRLRRGERRVEESSRRLRGQYGSAAATGAASPCTAVDDCPQPRSPCVLAACVAGRCVTTFSAPGTPVSRDSPPDCKAAVCGVGGAETTVIDSSNVPASVGDCV